MKTQTWHRILTHYLLLYFPEIARFAGSSRSDWFLAMIERFPTPASITSFDREAFSAEVWPPIGRKVSKARLITLPENSHSIRRKKTGGRQWL